MSLFAELAGGLDDDGKDEKVWRLKGHHHRHPSSSFLQLKQISLLANKQLQLSSDLLLNRKGSEGSFCTLHFSLLNLHSTYIIKCICIFIKYVYSFEYELYYKLLYFRDRKMFTLNWLDLTARENRSSKFFFYDLLAFLCHLSSLSLSCSICSLCLHTKYKYSLKTRRKKSTKSR